MKLSVGNWKAPISTQVRSQVNGTGQTSQHLEFSLKWDDLRKKKDQANPNLGLKMP